MLESSPWWGGCWRAGVLTDSATIQIQIQDSEMAHPNTYLIYKLLERVKEPVLLIQNGRIFMSWGSNRISQWSSDKDPVLMGQQKPEALTRPRTRLILMNICK